MIFFYLSLGNRGGNEGNNKNDGDSTSSEGLRFSSILFGGKDRKMVMAIQ